MSPGSRTAPALFLLFEAEAAIPWASSFHFSRAAEQQAMAYDGLSKRQLRLRKSGSETSMSEPIEPEQPYHQYISGRQPLRRL
jgi:hypothetical protein